MSADKTDLSDFICNVSLCGRQAEWRVDLFDKVEYYCNRHKPRVPDTFMTKINASAS